MDSTLYVDYVHENLTERSRLEPESRYVQTVRTPMPAGVPLVYQVKSRPELRRPIAPDACNV